MRQGHFQILHGSNHRGTAALLALALSLGAAASAAAAVESPAACSQIDPAHRAAAAAASTPNATITPPNPAGPTLVGAGVFVNDLSRLDPIDDTYRFRGSVRVTWCDPRRAFEPEPGEANERLYSGDAAARELEHVWFPGGFAVNQREQIQITERLLRVRPDGTIRHDLNFSLRLTANFELHRFPFDRQTLPLAIESFNWDRSALQFVADESTTGFADDFDLPEWTIEGVRSHVEEVGAMRSNEPFSRYVLEVEVARKSGFYLWKVLLPLAIIIALSWAIFWMHDETFAGRCRITSTGVLTVVAYQFAIAGGLPRVAYLTTLDKIMTTSFALLAITVVESAWVARCRDSNPERSLQIDRTSRWVFPLFYVVVVSAIALGVF